MVIKKWNTIETSQAANLKIFNAQWIRRIHPETKVTGNFVVLDSPQWVNIIPITKNNEVVLIEQYRHGSDSVTIEIPGGLIERGEEPIKAGMRECLEETGFSSALQPVLLGETSPNPAFLNNSCYSFLWQDCELTDKQKFDEHEDINVILVPLVEIKNYLIESRINHSLVMNAFFLYFLKNGMI
ncbi:MAG: NUDIX hydrolase [Candidatus Kapabacteria bacterium]|nr:NUDIX hydrolase [Candidatus Kapabacteria bacterium]